MDEKTFSLIWEQIALLAMFWPVSAIIGLSGYMVRNVRKTWGRAGVWCAGCGTAGSLACAASLLASPGSYPRAFWIGLAVSFMMGMSGSRDLPATLGLAIRVLQSLKAETTSTKKSDGES